MMFSHRLGRTSKKRPYEDYEEVKIMKQKRDWTIVVSEKVSIQFRPASVNLFLNCQRFG